MPSKAEEAFRGAKELAELVNSMITATHDLDLQRLLKQIEADLMDIQHKLALAIRISEREKP